MDTPKNELRQRLREMLSIPERERTDAQWDEIIELEIRLAPGNQIDPNRANEPVGVNQNYRQPRQNNKAGGSGHPSQNRNKQRRPNKHPSQRGQGNTGGGNQGGGNQGGNSGGGNGGGNGGGGGTPPAAA